MKFVSLVAAILCGFLVVSADNIDSLRLVHVFFRHGSRTPELKDTYPTDLYGLENFQPMGWGQLTNAGKHSAFRLGRLLRRRYGNFLGHIYTPDVVKASSTDVDRTKMTAMLVLAGLFPPPPSQIWNADIQWMPIPYHFDKDKYDYTLKRPLAYCPTYAKELEEVLSSDVVQRDLKAYRKLFQYVAKHARKPMNKLGDIFGMYQTLNAEETMNLTLPEWTKPVWPVEISAIAAKQCQYENYNAILKRLNGGRMLSKIIRNMVDLGQNELSPPGRKMFLYSGHENNVINILAALDLFEPPHVPKYSAAVIVELHHLGSTTSPTTGKYAVKVYYSRDVDAEPEVQKLAGCDVLCPLNNFIQITAPHVPVNYTAECGSRVNLD